MWTRSRFDWTELISLSLSWLARSLARPNNSSGRLNYEIYLKDLLTEETSFSFLNESTNSSWIFDKLTQSERATSLLERFFQPFYFHFFVYVRSCLEFQHWRGPPPLHLRYEREKKKKYLRDNESGAVEWRAMEYLSFPARTNGETEKFQPISPSDTRTHWNWELNASAKRAKAINEEFFGTLKQHEQTGSLRFPIRLITLKHEHC